jgi:DNA-binding CsgD family transcriptional regulator
MLGSAPGGPPEGIACGARANGRPSLAPPLRSAIWHGVSPPPAVPICLELLAAARGCAARYGRSPTWAAAAECDEVARESRRLLGSRLAAAAWERGLSMDVAAALVRARAGQSSVPATLPLTPRKTEIVRLVVLGLRNKEIGRRLSISERTVEAHLEQVRNQLGFHNRAQIAAWAATNTFDGASPDPASDGTF